MQKDVVGKTPPITHVRSAEEGLLVSSTNAAPWTCRSSEPSTVSRKHRLSPSWAI